MTVQSFAKGTDVEDRPISVLLIESNPQDVRLIQEMLVQAHAMHFELKGVDRLSAGLVRLATNNVGLVLLDLDLPDSRGFDTFAKAYALAPQKPIVVMTGLHDKEIALKAVQEGAQGYLVKEQLDSYSLVQTITGAIERKRAEEELRSQALIFENIHDGIIVTDLEGNIIRWNPAAEKMFGYYQDEVFQKTLGILSTRIMKGTLRDGRWSGEMGFTRKDGTEGICETTVIPLRDERGSISAVFGVARDVTERKQAEESLRKSEEKYRSIIENMQEGYFENDLAGNFTFVNDALCRLTGYPREELIGKNNRKYTNKKTAKEIYQIYNRIYRTGEPRKEIEEEYIRKDGKKGFAELSVSLISDAEGNPIGFRGISHDITERKQTEEALRKSERQLRLVADHVTDVIWSMDLDGNFTFVTPSAEEVVGYTVDEMLSLNLKQIITPESYHKTIDSLRERLNEGKREPVTMELEQVCKNGAKKWCEVTASLSLDQNNCPTGIIGVTRDITERKKAEDALQKSNDQLRESLITTVNTLAATIEMRDPYTAGHQRRVTLLASVIAEEMQFTAAQLDGLRLAGLIHDIGKINVPVEILNKPGRISETEFNIIKTHPQTGYNLLKEIEFPWPVAQIVLQHHERLDGSGYPLGLRDGGIMIEAKILAVADVVEAMASHRPYRPALGIEAALHEITTHRGILYDPEVADICARLFTVKGIALEQELQQFFPHW
jgi:PAS domain S-box-containing protein/putative nucleotidyltransferase with HDIG domain